MEKNWKQVQIMQEEIFGRYGQKRTFSKTYSSGQAGANKLVFAVHMKGLLFVLLSNNICAEET